MSVITCPSGLSGRVRGLKGKEAKLLSDRNAAKKGLVFEQILASCWEETLEPGPYELKHGKPDWSEVLVGDRFFVLMQIRIATFGDDIEFRVECENDMCGRKYNWELPLSQLPMKQLAPEALAKFQTGNRFETTISDGTTVYFGLRTGADEVKAAQMVRTSGMPDMVTALLFRIQEIEGVENGRKRAFADDLSLGDIRKLLADFDANDCGIETTIETECPSCGKHQECQLPFDGQFWMPEMKKR